MTCMTCLLSLGAGDVEAQCWLGVPVHQVAVVSRSPASGSPSSPAITLLFPSTLSPRSLDFYGHLKMRKSQRNSLILMVQVSWPRLPEEAMRIALPGVRAGTGGVHLGGAERAYGGGALWSGLALGLVSVSVLQLVMKCQLHSAWSHAPSARGQCEIRAVLFEGPGEGPSCFFQPPVAAGTLALGPCPVNASLQVWLHVAASARVSSFLSL